MHLKLHYGDGSLGETQFKADFMLPTYSLLVEVEGKKYKVSQQTLIEAVIDFHNKER